MPRATASWFWTRILQAAPAVSLRDLANCNVKVSANQPSSTSGVMIKPDRVVTMHWVEAFSDLMDNIPDRFQSKEKSTRKHRSSPNKHKSSQSQNPESQNSYPDKSASRCHRSSQEMFTRKLTNLALYSPDVLSNAVKVFNMHKKLERLKPTTPC